MSISSHLVTQTKQNIQLGSSEKQSRHLAKFLQFLLKYLSPRTQITYKWKLRCDTLCEKKTQIIGAEEVGQIVPENQPCHTSIALWNQQSGWFLTLNPIIFNEFWHMHVCYSCSRGCWWFKMIFGDVCMKDVIGLNELYICCKCAVVGWNMKLWWFFVWLSEVMFRGNFPELKGEI